MAWSLELRDKYLVNERYILEVKSHCRMRNRVNSIINQSQIMLKVWREGAESLWITKKENGVER